MRKNTLAYSCLMMALAVPMPSIADDPVELRPDDPVYVKLGQKNLYGSMRKLSWGDSGRAGWLARQDG